MEPEAARRDFLERVHAYEKVYESISDEENSSYIKLINVGQKVITRMCTGANTILLRHTFKTHYHDNITEDTVLWYKIIQPDSIVAY